MPFPLPTAPGRRTGPPAPFFLAALALGLLLPAAPPAHAAGDDSAGIYVQGGHNFANGTDTHNAFIGGTLPWGGRRAGGGLTTYADAYAGAWRGLLPDGVNHRTYHQVAALAVARWRFDGGRSPWFADAGAGLSYLDGQYAKPGGTFDGRPGRVFGSRWNFTLRAGVGRSFGEDGRHEVSLNYQHYSDAGLKRPNPGEDFLQVRYAYKF